MVDDARGNMDISAQDEMYNIFCSMTKWGIISVTVILALMAIFLL